MISPSASSSKALLAAACYLLWYADQGSAEGCWRNTTCTWQTESSFPGEWEEASMFSPESRTVEPLSAFNVDSHEKISTWPDSARLTSEQTGLYFDFGQEVGGIVTVQYDVSSTAGSGALGLGFTESVQWIGRQSDGSSGRMDGSDGVLIANFSETGQQSYTMPDEKLRGGFRYLTLFAVGEEVELDISAISLEISFQPTWSNLRAYRGYFHTSDDLLNQIWYSGAYTLQTNAIAANTGRDTSPATSWSNAAVLGTADTYSVDGAKRDRSVWPGDMGIALPSSFYGTGDIESLKNSLQTLYDAQDATSGAFPYAGPPLFATGSVTYHMWTMIGTHDYVLYSDDTDFLDKNWEGYLKAMKYVSSLVNKSSGLLNVTDVPADWGQPDVTGFLNSAQSTYYQTLVSGAQLAKWAGDSTGRDNAWKKTAKALSEAVISSYWDADAGAMKNNLDGYPSAALLSQGGNSLALFSGLLDATSDKAQKASVQLTQNWTPIGPSTPELPGEIGTFPASFEAKAHLIAGQAQRGLDMIRTCWGWYLNNENGTQSTMVEGYLTNGTWGYRWDQGYNGDFAYTSHAHGWATGPVAALSEHIVGLTPTGRAGKTWKLAPQFGDLNFAQGGFTTKLGKFSSSWKLSNGTEAGYVLEYSVPEDTTGHIVFPKAASKSASKVSMDGEALELSSGGLALVQGSGGRELFSIMSQGGSHKIEVQ